MATTGGGCGKNGRVTPCLRGEPPSGSWEKGTEYVCSVVSGRGGLGMVQRVICTLVLPLVARESQVGA